MFHRIGGALIVLFASMVIIPVLLSLNIMKDLEPMYYAFIIIAFVLIIIGAIVYIFREKRF